MDVILTEYNEEAHIANERKWSYEDGKEEGREEGKREGIKEGREEGIRMFIEDNLEEQVSEERIKEKLIRRFSLSKERAEELLEKYNTSTVQ